jgi:hypothetical protein
MSDAHARRSDPLSSHDTVKSIAKDGTMRGDLLDAARTFPGRFNDTELWERVEMRTGRRWQRNVVARTRDLMEHDGIFVRVGMASFRGGRELVDFELAEHLRTPSVAWEQPTLL